MVLPPRRAASSRNAACTCETVTRMPESISPALRCGRQAGERVHNHARGDLAGGMATRAIRHHPKPEIRPGQHIILVMFAHRADIRQRPGMWHQHVSFAA